ncbi:Heterokaryon incompatibility protein 6,OR allele [Lachnellula occidentalis]|uniref:Heterokaryon incompatibility protein 6,OR allele n=1 Tax=Lachnellula occidentalis TaxID=215460 RepID=A0A8H8RMI0_9HELO|nr:Heterokaryon incompatibility protein 6,OR allele [Lachnellula occidentalis]
MSLLADNIEASLYDPLPDLQSIRCIVILPGIGSEIVSCQLDVISLGESYSFQALSYVWGNPNPPQYIECDGILKSVTPNLLAALRSLRSETEVRWMWIDALCINQLDLAERSQQVLLMRRIYTEADGVIVYLGDDDNGQAAIALDLIKKASDHHVKDMAQNSGFSLHLGETEAKDFPPLVKDNPAWNAVSWFLDLPWFGRVWVLQEVAFQEATMMIGKSEIEWRDVAKAIVWLQAKSCLRNSCDRWRSERLISIEIAATPNIGLFEILATSADFEASDPRDHVYALLGLAKNSDTIMSSPLLRPDYTKTLKQVNSSLVRYFLQNSGDGQANLDILSLVTSRGSDPDVVEDLPSWAPRFHGKFFGNTRLAQGQISETWRASKCLAVQLLESEDENSLILQGLKITRIISSDHSFESVYCDSGLRLLNAVKELLEKKVKPFEFKCADTAEESLAQTLTAGWPRSGVDKVWVHNEDNLTDPYHAADLEDYLFGPQSASPPEFSPFTNAMHCGGGEAIFLTESGHIGIGAKELQVGDFIFFGGMLCAWFDVWVGDR